MDRWGRLIEIRDRVNAVARRGTAAEEHRQFARGASRAWKRPVRRRLLERYTADLPMVFIASQVSLRSARRHPPSRQPSRSTKLPTARSARAAGVSSPHFSLDNLKGLCERCAEAARGN